MQRTAVGDVMTTRVVAVKKDASFKQMIIKMRPAPRQRAERPGLPGTSVPIGTVRALLQ